MQSPDTSEAEDFDERRAMLMPTLGFCALFFSIYYLLLGLEYGFSSVNFVVRNVGGAGVFGGFVLAHLLTRRWRSDGLLLLPSFATGVGACSIFLLHEGFYREVDHLWLSAQIIAITFSIFLGTPKWNVVLFAVNIAVPLALARQVDYLDPVEILDRQGIVYFASLVSIGLSVLARDRRRDMFRLRDAALQASDDVKAGKQKLEQERSLLAKVLSSIPHHVSWRDGDAVYLGCNQAFARFVGRESPDDVIGRTDDDLWGEAETATRRAVDADILDGRISKHHAQETHRTPVGDTTLDVSKVPLLNADGEVIGVLDVAVDLTEHLHLERELRRAQKLESIGQLAAGVAHEINTPAQYVTDNLRFLREGFADLTRVIAGTAHLSQAAIEAGVLNPEVEALGSVREAADLDFLEEEIPRSFEQTLDGMHRISEIVRAMKDFSHPGQKFKEPANLNDAIISTAIVCRSRWRYVAELTTDLAPDLPVVPCLLGDINQVLLNLIVNAADAITDHRGDDDGPGVIHITSSADREYVSIAVHDSGGGIPADIQDRIFDPFFTTKEVGRGTGQGLALSYDMIVNKHNGRIDVTSRPGEGSTFTIAVPLEAATDTDTAPVPVPA
ncbi:MAG: ATP-binding protein [Actinomycetota bacterium]